MQYIFIDRYTYEHMKIQIFKIHRNTRKETHANTRKNAYYKMQHTYNITYSPNKFCIVANNSRAVSKEIAKPDFLSFLILPNTRLAALTLSLGIRDSELQHWRKRNKDSMMEL